MSPKPIRLFSRAAAMLLTFMMAFTAQTARALNGPDSGTCGANGDNLRWTLAENGETVTISGESQPALTLTITGSGAMADYAQMSGAPWAEDRTCVTKLSLPEGITHIGNYAFAFSHFSGNLTIPSTVETIGNFGFYCFYGATSVTIPASVTSIGKNGLYAFGQDASSCTVTFDEGSQLNSIGTFTFSKVGHNVNLENCTQLTTIPIKAFNGFKGSVTLPFSITKIEANAFYLSPNGSSTVKMAYNGFLLVGDELVASGTGTADITRKLNLTYSGHEEVAVRNVSLSETSVLTLGPNVTATGSIVEVNSTTYALPGGSVTIGYSGTPTGYLLAYTVTKTDDGTDITATALSGSTLTMPDYDVTVSVNTEDLAVIDWAEESEGDKDHPYMIYNKDQLLLLAYRVNGTHDETANDYRGKYFKLGNDIKFSYDPNEGGDYAENYEVIGGQYNNINHYFEGDFDGDGYTVSGIRIRKTGYAYAYAYQGLFGIIGSDANIHDVHLTDTRIKGYDYISGIVGYSDGTVSNCTVTESDFTSTYYYYGTICGRNCGTLQNNYYRHCTVNGEAVISGMGCHRADVTTNDGAVPMYVAYTDADGIQQRCIDYTELQGGGATTLSGGWYVVNSDVNYTGTITLGGDATLILADGKTMTSSSYSYGIDGYSNGYGLTIYGQALGTGTLNATGTGTNGIGIYTDGNVTINGGTVIATGTDDVGIRSVDGVTINGGTVTTTGVMADGDVTISGGKVTATDDPGISSNDGSITLSWTSPDDRITASSYFGTMTIASGKAFTNEDGDIYSGTLSSDDKTAIADQTLRPLTAVSLADNASNTTAIEKLDGVEDIDITLQGRTLWKDGNWNTICLPFDVTVGSGQFADATAMTMNASTSGFDTSTGVLTLNFDNVASGSTIAAGTPFIVKWTGDNVTSPVFSGVTISSAAAVSVKSTDNTVQFLGTYSPLEFTINDKSNLFLGVGKNEKDEDVSTLFYPNASNADDDKYHFNSFRAYFQLTDPSATVKAFNLNFDGGETSIHNAQCTIHNEAAAWYTLDGRKVANGQKPTAKGIYVNKGIKVIIK